jgi:starvation-inducible outer membrane lipoprotein
MFNKISLLIIVAFILGGCASVPMESLKGSNDAKQFGSFEFQMGR